MAFPVLWWLSLQPCEGGRYLFHLLSLTEVMFCAVKPQLCTANPLVKYCATSSRLLLNNHRNLHAYVHVKVAGYHYSIQLLLQCKSTRVLETDSLKTVHTVPLKIVDQFKLLSPQTTPQGTSVPTKPLPVLPSTHRVIGATTVRILFFLTSLAIFK